MKKIFLIFVFVIISSNIFAQDWRAVTAPSFSPLNGVFFLDENNGWAVGSSSELLITTDGGMKWERPGNPLPIDASIYCVQFLDINNGFLGAADEQFLKTIDGGANWSVLVVPGISGSIKGLYFSDASNGWIMSSTSSQANIAHTTDGGATWTVDLTHSTGDLEAMDFFEANKGVCVGGGLGKLDLYYTTDGVTWNVGQNPTLPPVYTRTDARCVVMTDAMTAYVSGWGSRAAGLQPSIQLKTTDAGATWTYMEQLEVNRTYVNINGMYFKDGSNGLVTGGGSYEGTVLVKTTDAGVNWIVIDAPFGFTAKALYGIGDKVWMVGGSGGLAYSPDFGTTWQIITEIPSSSLYALKFASENLLVAAGFDGLVVKSTDGGNEWKSVYASVNKLCPTIQGFHFIDANIGFLARNNRMACKTTDGGETWSMILKDSSITSMTNYGVYFLDENYGFVVGKIATGVAAIYKTTDSGVSWTIQEGGFVSHLNDVVVRDQNNIVIVGEDLVAAYSTDGGATWNNSTMNNLPGPAGAADLNYLHFMNSTTGLLCGNEVLMKTTDGGVNWDYIAIPGLDKELKTCVMATDMHWLTVGDDYVFETTDGGTTWNDIADPLVIVSSSVYGVAVDTGGYPWVSGAGSGIYTKAPIIVGVTEMNNILPDEFSLAQNYPNPFNPATIIEFSIPTNGIVNVTVYDVLGRIVKELINEYKSSGSYKVNFDASDLTSGIYFYTLSVEGKSFTNKMVLLR